ncbi:preprotein translocase subunit SecE [Parvibium lacunae]|uniref:Protein translocase subunit SecE n=1 Tax=Parvibium lacunae TaxID=1888893 RepID=A0A368KZ31_9BURK|nr:preprotein translocase subunit SecE [Parvibium lacunae]RCS56648.1 preprotein translocase subunit SecE [Parvibium lacunae]
MSASSVETVNVTADRIKVALAALLVGAGIVGFYVLPEQQVAARVGAVLAGLVLGVIVFFLSASGKQLWAFGQDAIREAQRVVWPTRKETLQMTGIVFVFVVVMAIFLWTTDKTLEWVLYDLILGWKK